MRFILVLALCLVACGKEKSGIRQLDPTGAKAHYVIDTNPARTMAQVKGGTFDLSVGSLDTAAQSFPVTVAYSIKIAILGTKTGTKTLSVEADYWTDAFWTKFRSTKHFETSQFKADYLGSETIGGQVYDDVRLYDIKNIPGVSSDLSGVVVLMPVNIKYIPGIGALKADVSGSVSGQNIKVGADYTPKGE